MMTELNMRAFAWILLAVVITCGCRSRREHRTDLLLPIEDEKPVTVQNREGDDADVGKPVDPEDEFMAQPVSEPKLRRGLLLSVVVLVGGEKEVDEPSVMVDSEGMLSLPLLGKIDVAGKTLDETTSLLKERYDSYFVDPRVSLRFCETEGDATVSPWGFVTVLGRVKTPGPVKIPPTQDLTVSQALQQAGGFDKAARKTKIRITRRRADGTTMKKTIDLHSVGAEGKVADDIVLRPGDVVHVPEAIL